MRRVLILGGIREARELAENIAAQGFHVTYSVAGITDPPRLRCEVRHGGFGGVEGLRAYLRSARVDLLIDATHPYAETISRHAAGAAAIVGIPSWGYHRPGWTRYPGDEWRFCSDWEAIVAATSGYGRPFFTVGRTPLENLDAMTSGQHWLVRSLVPCAPRHPRLTSIVARGPFTVSEETELMREFRVDVLVSKDSGGDSVAAKLSAARQLGIPVAVWARPAPPIADRSFQSTRDLVAALLEGGR